MLQKPTHNPAGRVLAGDAGFGGEEEAQERELLARVWQIIHLSPAQRRL